MSRIINAQAGVMQGLMGLPQTAAADMTADMDGGFGAVLGAVMADNSAGSDVGGVFGQAAVSAADTAAEVSAGVVNDGAAVSSGEVKASGGEAGSEKALYDLLEAAFSDDEGDVPSMETFFAVLTGSAPEGASDMFTSRGAAAFLSAVSRFFADDDEGVSGERLMAMWQGVSANEKSAYADILSAIAGRAGVPEEETVSAGELLSAAVKTAVKAVARLPLDRKDRDKVSDNVPEYLMAAFIAPGYDFRAAAVSGDKADMAVSAALSGSAVEVSGEQLPLDMNAGQQVPGEAADSNAAGSMTEAMQTEPVMPDMTAMQVSEAAQVTQAAPDMLVTQSVQSAVDEILEADSEDIAEFCNILARELGVQIESELAADRQPRPADIGRQAFMARVGRGNEADFTGVSGSISRSVNSVTFVSGEAEGVSEDIPAAEAAMSGEGKNVGSEGTFAGGDMPGDKAVSGRENVPTENASAEDVSGKDKVVTAFAKADMPIRTDIPMQQTAQGVSVPIEAAEDTVTGDRVNAYDTGAIADRIAYSAYRAEGDSTQLTLRLSPEELGEIRVTIVRKAGETSVAFEAQKSESAAVIGDRAAALAEALVSKGISLKEISVSDMGRNATSDGRGGQGYSENRQPQDNEGGHRYSRHFYYSREGDEQPEGDNFGAISSYYDKEANLWLSI